MATLNIDVRGRNIDVTSALQDHVERKLNHLTRFFDGLDMVHVRLSASRGQHTVEVTIPVSGMVLRGEERCNDMYAAVDRVADKLQRQVKKYHTRLNAHGHERLGDLAAADDQEADVAAEPLVEGHVVRRKHFSTKPMAIDEAIMEMNLVGHDFYAFRNAETEVINVLYRRYDGDYGLLQPDL